MTTAQVNDVLPIVPAREPRSAGGIVYRAGVWLLLAVITVASICAGVKLRQWTWEMTDPIHFRGDITRGYGWGREAATNGYLNLYEKMSSQQPRWGYWLDYAPLRLAVMTGWSYWTRAHFANPDGSQPEWRSDYEFNRFVLTFNMAMELLGSVCAFLLTRLWVKRAHGDANAPPFTGFLSGTIAGLYFWFNPAIHLSAHGWPTWDMWIMPMYLLAVLLASHDRWFSAGLAVAVGAMFKGQQWTVAPLFVIWPLVMGRFDAALKWAIGALFGVAALASPWLLTYVPADAMAAMRAVQFDGTRAPWDLSRLKLPERVMDVAAVTWIAGLAAVAVLLPPVLPRWRRSPSGVNPPPDEAMDRAKRFRSAPSTLRQAVARVGERKLWHVAVAIIPWLLVLGAYGCLLAVARGQLIVSLTVLRVVQAVYLIACPLAMALTIAIARPQLGWGAKTVASTVAFGAMAWPALIGANRPQWASVCLVATVFAVILPLVRPRHIYLLAAAATGGALLWCQTLFNGSEAWWVCGWKYGTIHWPLMVMGVTSNLPGILKERYGFHSPEIITDFFTIPPEMLLGYPRVAIELTIKQVLAVVYAVTLLASAVGIGLHARRRDPRVLVAFTTPWLMFFCFPVQIHERYLLYAAGVGAITVGAGAGPMLMCAYMSIVTWIMTMHVMLNAGDRERFGQLLHETFPSLFEPTAADTLHRFIGGTYPDIGWSILFCAVVFLYLTLVPSRRRADRLPLQNG
jgi:hypothetical protein